MNGAHPTPLKFLHPGWFTLVMGLSGLALAWHAAGPVLGPWAEGAALVIGALAAAVFVAVLIGSLLRWRRHPEAVAEDLRGRDLEVATGRFGADMKIDMEADGPVTILIEAE